MRLILLIAAASILTPAAAFERGFWVAGLAWLDGEGEWGARRLGLSEEGGYGVLRLEAAAEDPWDAPKRRRMRLSVRDLGLPVAGARWDAGVDGRMRVGLVWVRRGSAEGRAESPYRGIGGARLGLPENWRAGPSTAAFRLPELRLQRFDYGKRRERLALGWRWIPAPELSMELGAERERRQGLKPFGAVVGTTGGNARAVILPWPIDETTLGMRLGLSRGAADRAWRLEARLSEYRDRIGALVWDHPFANVPGLPPEAGWPRAVGQAASPPDNRGLFLHAGGWRRLGPSFLLHGDLMVGRHLQDARFLPYTIHPDWLARPIVPLPRERLGGDVRLERLAGRAEWRLGGGFDATFLARHERRDDRAPSALFRQVPSDAAPQPAQPDARWRLRLPIDWRERTLEAGLARRWPGGQRLALRLERSDIARRFAERDRTEEHRLLAEGASGGPWATRLSLQAEWAERRGDAYLGERPFLAAFLPEYVATVPGGFENAPELRRSHLADRDRRALRLGASRAFDGGLELALRWHHLDDDFAGSSLGLLKSGREALAVELSRPLPGEGSVHGFAIRERADSAQAGHSFRGGANRLPDLSDPARRWRVEQADRIDALGLAARFPAGQGRIDLSLTALRYRTRFAVEAGAALAAAPLPELGGRAVLGTLRATLPLAERLSLVAEWRGERHRFRDPLVRGLAADQLAGVLLSTPSDRPGPAQVLLIALHADFP
jgi:hypothetical protein